MLSPIGFNANGYWRFYNDVLLTWKATNTWTFVTEANWIRDGFGSVVNPGKAVNGFGVASVRILCAERNALAECQGRSLA